MNRLVAIVGPTGVGKSARALSLALRFGGEIVNADSRQVYRYLDIGTAKPSMEERASVPHHLIDVVDPDGPFNLALYLDMAAEAIRDIQARGCLPFLVGGTGQYVWALLEGWRLPGVPPDPGLRLALEERARRGEGPALYAELERRDPEAARRIDPRNVQRVIRALEVGLKRGAFSPQKAAPPYQALILGLALPRPELYRRIDQRVERMMEQGLVEEVKGLLERGYSPGLPALSGLGYRQVCRYLEGELSLEEAVAQFKAQSHRYARQQHAWFRLTDPRIRWLGVGEEAYHEAEALVASFIGSPEQKEGSPEGILPLGVGFRAPP